PALRRGRGRPRTGRGRGRHQSRRPVTGRRPSLVAAGRDARPPHGDRVPQRLRDRRGPQGRRGHADQRGGGRSLSPPRRRRDQARSAAARRAGLDSLFVGDHHATPAPYYQNVPITARMLAEWGSAPAGCLFLLPLWNPVLLAEQVGTLASIAAGRFIIQVGLGDDEAQFAAMGATLKTRTSAFEQSLDIVRRLLAGEVVSANGRFTFRDARVALR